MQLTLCRRRSHSALQVCKEGTCTDPPTTLGQTTGPRPNGFSSGSRRPREDNDFSPFQPTKPIQPVQPQGSVDATSFIRCDSRRCESKQPDGSCKSFCKAGERCEFGSCKPAGQCDRRRCESQQPDGSCK